MNRGKSDNYNENHYLKIDLIGIEFPSKRKCSCETAICELFIYLSETTGWPEKF